MTSVDAGMGRDARSRAFVAALPTTGAVVFVQDRYGECAVRDLVILTHGVRVAEVTSVYVVERVEDEVPFRLETRRPVFLHPDLIEARAARAADGPRVPRNAPININLADAAREVRSAPRTLPTFRPVTTAVPDATVIRPETSAAPGSLDTLLDWAMPDARSPLGPGPEPEGDLIIATINIVRDRRAVRPYLIQAPSLRRGTFLESHDTLDAAIAALPAVARRVIGIPRA